MKCSKGALGVFIALIFMLSSVISAQTTQEELQQKMGSLRARLTELSSIMQEASETGDLEGYNAAKEEAENVQEELKQITEDLTALANVETRARRAYNEGLNALRRRDYPTAVSKANEAVELMPDYPRAFLIMGLAHFQQRNFEEAENAYKKSIELDPADPNVWENLGSLYDAMGRVSDAHEAFSRSIDIDSTKATVYYRKGSLYSKNNDHLKAITEFQKATEQDPAYKLAFNALGVAYKELNRYANAKAAFEAAVAVDENYGEAWIRLSDVLYELGEYDKAIEAADKGIQHERRRVLHAIAYLAKGKAFHGKGDNAKAKEALEKAAENRSFANYANWYIENKLNQ